MLFLTLSCVLVVNASMKLRPAYYTFQSSSRNDHSISSRLKKMIETSATLQKAVLAKENHTKKK